MEKIRILFAEDDALTRWEVKGRMEEKGWEVIEAENGVKALEKYKQAKPDLVILDVDMPGMTGLEVLQLIRTEDQEIPVIIYSSLTSEKDVWAGYLCGAKVYVVKNYSVAILVVQAERLLTNRKEVEIISLAPDASYNLMSSLLTIKGKTVKLTKLENKIFTVLCKNPNKLIKRELLVKAGWNSDEARFEIQLNKVIHKLRILLAPLASVEIVTDKGNGYWFMC